MTLTCCVTSASSLLERALLLPKSLVKVECIRDTTACLSNQINADTAAIVDDDVLLSSIIFQKEKKYSYLWFIIRPRQRQRLFLCEEMKDCSK